MDLKEKNTDQKTQAICIACRETIIPGASLCPHCNSYQRKSILNFLSVGLKWVGGFTAIFSLVILVNQTQNLLEKLKSTQEAVSQRVASAKLQSKIGDYSGAFQQIKQALVLNPSSPKANSFEVELAMDYLRSIKAIDKRIRVVEQYNSTKDYQLGLILYRGAVSATTVQEKATILAHLGWLNILRMRSGTDDLDIDYHFKKALEIDPDNLYANAMWGAWIPNQYNEASYEEGVLPLSRKLFKKALQNQEARRYVRELQVKAYKSHSLELLRIGHEMYETGEFRDIQPFPIQAFRINSREHLRERDWKELTDNFSLEKILALTEWLLAEYPSFDNESILWANGALKETLYFSQGRVLTELGYYQRALEALRKTQSLFIARLKYSSTLHAEKDISGQAKNRLTALAKELAIELAPVLISYGGSHQSTAKEAGLMSGDAILFLNGKPLHFKTDYKETNISEEIATVKVLRDGRLVEIKFPAAENGIHTRQILAPITLWETAISSETTLEELYRVWINPHEVI
jgi:tetratricopeptide (TPR) repeat protein